MEEADRVGADDSSDRLAPATVFVDTSVLLNYAQRGVEPDYTSNLIDSSRIEIVVGVTVANELDDVRERREDIYADFVDFLLAEEGEISDYDPDDRRPYFRENDRRHVRNIQMHLAQLGERAEIQRQLRQFTRAVERRLDHLLADVLPDATFDLQPGLAVMFALESAISNDKDRSVVGDAALWAAEEPASSGVFVTMDKEDLLDAADEINAALRDAKGTEWELTIIVPTDLSLEPDAPAADPSVE